MDNVPAQEAWRRGSARSVNTAARTLGKTADFREELYGTRGSTKLHETGMGLSLAGVEVPLGNKADLGVKRRARLDPGRARSGEGSRARPQREWGFSSGLVAGEWGFRAK